MNCGVPCLCFSHSLHQRQPQQTYLQQPRSCLQPSFLHQLFSFVTVSLLCQHFRELSHNMYRTWSDLKHSCPCFHQACCHFILNLVLPPSQLYSRFVQYYQHFYQDGLILGLLKPCPRCHQLCSMGPVHQQSDPEHLFYCQAFLCSLRQRTCEMESVCCPNYCSDVVYIFLFYVSDLIKINYCVFVLEKLSDLDIYTNFLMFHVPSFFRFLCVNFCFSIYQIVEQKGLNTQQIICLVYK